MRIGELAAQSGFTVETIRFYEEKGLLPPAGRTPSNYRVYSETHLERLRFIRHCRTLDMSLEDITKLLHFDAMQPEDCRRVHAMITQHVQAISEKIQELRLLREHLLALALRCPGHFQGKPCGILTGLREDAKQGACCCGVSNEAATNSCKKTPLDFGRPR